MKGQAEMRWVGDQWGPKDKPGGVCPIRGRELRCPMHLECRTPIITQAQIAPPTFSKLEPDRILMEGSRALSHGAALCVASDICGVPSLESSLKP